MKMTKKERKAFALDIMSSAIGCAYYGLESHDELSDADEKAILELINVYGEKACSAIGIPYITY